MEENFKIRKYIYEKLKSNLDSKNPFMEYTLNFLDWQDGYQLYDRELLEDLILKTAIWYEFKYPRQVIYNMFNDLNDVKVALPISKEVLESLNREELELVKTIFSLSKSRDILQFDNLNTSLDSFLREPRFKSQIRIPSAYCYINVTSDGLIKDGFDYYLLKKRYKIDDSYIGKYIEELKPILQECDRESIDEAILDYNNQVYFYNGLLTCVLYKILERGLKHHDYGIERALLFAKEFDLDTSIPLRFGSSSNKPAESYLSRSYNSCKKAFNKEDLQEKLILILKERLYQEETKVLKK